MEIINAETRNKEGLKVTIAITRKEIYFNKMASDRFDITPHRMITFLTDVDRLFFYVSDDPNGLKIHQCTQGGTKVYNTMVYRVLLEKIPYLLANGHIFPLKRSNSEMQGNKLIEVLFHKKP
jgi:hypothetical protein